MNRDECVTLLQRLACRDNRKPSAAMLATWEAAMSDVELPDAIEAVNLLDRTTDEWVMPIHVRDAIVVVRRERGRAERSRLAALEMRSYEQETVAARESRRRAREACGRCDDRGRLGDGRFCDHGIASCG